MKKVGRKIAEVSLRSMNDKTLSLFAVLLLCCATGWTAPQQPYGGRQAVQIARPTQGEDLTTALRQFKTGLADLRHEVTNHETEIRLFENKLQSQETSFENLQQQLNQDIQSQRDYARASTISLEGKIESVNQAIINLEGMLRGLSNDLRQVKIQSNDSVTVLGQYKLKISELESALEKQNQHMENLEAALQSMMEVWQAKESVKEIINKPTESPIKFEVDGGKIYKVQAGDSLEKIARAQKVSVQAIREANQLTNDRILIGQKLKIP